MIGGDREGSSAGARLAVAAAFLALAFLQWKLVSRRPPPPATWEPALHMRAALKYGEDIAQGRWKDLSHPLAEAGRPPSPPVFHWTAAAGISLGGRLGMSPEDGAALANIFFLFLLAWSAYLLATDWWGESAGVAAAFLASLSTPFLDAARAFLPDAALAAWVLLSYVLWEKSRRFTLWRECLALGLVAAAGVLTGTAFLTYTAPIAAAALWELFRPAERGARFRAAATLAMAAVLAGSWHWINRSGPVAAALGSPGGGPRGLDALFYYLGVFKDGIGWIGLAAAAAGFVWTALRYARNGWVLASWLASSYVLWTFVPDKDPRRMLPALPVLALSAAGLPFRLPLVLAAALAVKAFWFQ